MKLGPTTRINDALEKAEETSSEIQTAAKALTTLAIVALAIATIALVIGVNNARTSRGL